MAGLQQTAPPQQHHSKDDTAHPHQPGARPEPPHPDPAHSHRHHPAKAEVKFPLQNRIFPSVVDTKVSRWKCGDVETKLNTVNMTVWVHKACDIIEEEALTKLQEAWDSSEQKDECTVCLDDLERAYWMGTEVGLLDGYGFQGVTLGVDGSCKDGKMGSGCCKFKEEGASKCARVGREEEGTSSNRPELGGIVLALQSAALSEDTLLLCDNEAVLCVIKKWVGQGGKVTLVTVTDPDILQEIVWLLTQRVRAGRATFLIKVKSYHGEPINERADTLAEKGLKISDDNKRWDDRTDWMMMMMPFNCSYRNKNESLR
jgi:ribonuclease HI